MLRRIGVALIAPALLWPLQVTTQKGGRSPSTRRSSSSTRSRSSSSKPTTTRSRKSSVPKKSTVAPRSSNGRIKRSASARVDFMRRTVYPKGRKGYVVDHIIPLECGGSDSPSNMQVQTVQEAKIKDRTERNCRRE
jgi:cytoskeletal protein RodZ